MEFFNAFLDPNTINTLSTSEKLLASIFVTLLGMGTTFVGLIVIQYMIGFMSKGVKSYEDNVASKDATIQPVAAAKPAEPAPVVAAAEEEDEEALIAVLTAAVAVMMQKSTSQIVIRNVRQVNGSSLAWSSAGRNEVMNSRF